MGDRFLRPPTFIPSSSRDAASPKIRLAGTENPASLMWPKWSKSEPELPQRHRRCTAPLCLLPQFCNALLKLPAFSRTPGNGARFQRWVMNFRIDVVS